MEIASNGSYTFCRALLSFEDTVSKYVLIGIEPVLERNSGKSKMKFDICGHGIWREFLVQPRFVVCGYGWFDHGHELLRCKSSKRGATLPRCSLECSLPITVQWFSCCVDLVVTSNHPEVMAIRY
jgi:hypothetical protein